MKKMRNIPILSDEERKMAEENGAFQRRYKEISEGAFRTPTEVPSDPKWVEPFKNLVNDMIKKANDSLISSNKLEQAEKILEPYHPPFTRSSNPEAGTAPSEDKTAEYRRVFEAARNQKKQNQSFIQTKALSNVYIHAENHHGQALIEMAWTEMKGGFESLQEWTGCFDLDESLQEEEALFMMNMLKNREHIMFEKSEVFRIMKSVHDHYFENSAFHECLYPNEVMVIAPELGYTAATTIEDLALELKLNAELVKLLYKTAPNAALIQRIYTMIRVRLIQ